VIFPDIHLGVAALNQNRILIAFGAVELNLVHRWLKKMTTLEFAQPSLRF